jgi:hypothetical protein
LPTERIGDFVTPFFGNSPTLGTISIQVRRAVVGDRGSILTLRETLISIWQKALAEGKSPITLEGRRYSVRSTRAKRLHTVCFDFADYRLDGIEQNPETTSRWAALAREWKRAMQFSYKRRYVANVCEGALTRYPAWHALRLPE